MHTEEAFLSHWDLCSTKHFRIVPIILVRYHHTPEDYPRLQLPYQDQPEGNDAENYQKKETKVSEQFYKIIIECYLNTVLDKCFRSDTIFLSSFVRLCVFRNIQPNHGHKTGAFHY